MTGPEGNSEFCFPRIATLRFEGNKIHRSPRDQSLSDLLYSKTKQKQNLKTALRFQRSFATAVNISRVTVNCFPFDVIVFPMLPTHGIWWETVSLLDVMWPWTSQWMGALQREKRQLYNKKIGLIYQIHIYNNVYDLQHYLLTNLYYSHLL